MSEKSKTMCQGCQNDFYFQNATVVVRLCVGTWEQPPYHPSRASKYLSCYSEDGSSMIKPDDCRVRDTPFPTV